MDTDKIGAALAFGVVLQNELRLGSLFQIWVGWVSVNSALSPGSIQSPRKMSLLMSRANPNPKHTIMASKRVQHQSHCLTLGPSFAPSPGIAVCGSERRRLKSNLEKPHFRRLLGRT